VIWHLMSENVAALVEPPESEPRDMHPLTSGQACQLLDTIAGHRLFAPYFIAVSLGLRHTAASLMLAAGVPITDVSEILGHSSPAITARIYAHAYEEGKRHAVETMARLLRKVEV
jgi:integrase